MSAEIAKIDSALSGEEVTHQIDPQVASDYRDLLITTGKPWKHRYSPTPELEERIERVLDAVSLQVPGINRASLGRIIREDSLGVTRAHMGVGIDFPQLAANWDNDVFKDSREMAEKEFNIGEKEVEFLQAVFAQNPPHVDNHWQYH